MGSKIGDATVIPPEKKNDLAGQTGELSKTFGALSDQFSMAKYGQGKDEMWRQTPKGAPGAISDVDTPHARGGGGRVVQDFRYSKFTIDQKFAEGMDPDRVAVVLAEDIKRVGERKLQSAFDPVGSYR